MKINNKKIVVPALAMAMAAALAGSIAGSVAWYQYSTRATSFLNGTTAGTSRNLQLASVLDDVNDVDDIHWDYHYDGGSKNEFAPTTVKFNDNDVVESFVSHPVYQHFENWVPTVEDDFSYTLYFQSLDSNKEREELDLFLTEFRLEVADKEGHDDSAAALAIKKAFRVEMVTYNYDGSAWVKDQAKILSEEAGTTTTNDYLNLNKEDNKIMDHDGFAADDSMGDAQKYKAGKSFKSKILEENEELKGWYLDSALTQPAFSNAVEVVANTNIEDKNLFEDKELTIPAKNGYHVVHANAGDPATGLFKDDALTEPVENFHEVKGYLDGSGEDLFLEEELTNPAPNPLTANDTYYAAGVAAGDYYAEGTAAGTYYCNYTKVHKTTSDSGEFLFEDEACTEPAKTLSNGKLEAEGDYFIKNLADGTTEYYQYQKLSDSYDTIAYSGIVAGDANPYEFTNKGTDNANALIKTNKEYPVRIDIRVWLEGWHQGDAVSTHLDEGMDGTGYYTDANCASPVVNSHQEHIAAGESNKDLFLDDKLEDKAIDSHVVHLSEGEDGSEYYNDPELTIHARNYHKVTIDAGDDATGLFLEPTLENKVLADSNGKAIDGGTYYAFGVEEGDYYIKGVAENDYYKFGVEEGDYYSKGYIWNTDTIGSTFQLGLRFGVEADK